MTDPNYVYVAFVLDKSGSMADMMPEPITGFNAFLDAQKNLPGKCTLRLVKFDTLGIDSQEKPINDFEPLNEKTYKPGAGTPLLDAVAGTIDDVGKILSITPENDRPGKVLFVILTDGEENSSSRFTLEDVQSRIKTQIETYKWEFMYLGVSNDKFAQEKQAAQMAIPTDFASQYEGSQRGMGAAYSAVTNSVTSSRTSGNPNP